MNTPIVQLLILAGIAVFLILRLRNVLGTRDGYEKPVERTAQGETKRRHDFEVIDGGPDRDITDHVETGSESADALARMKGKEPNFGVADFLQGSRGAYEMILMAFERGDLASIKPFLSSDVYESFAYVVEDREARGLKIEADFIGVRETQLQRASLDSNNMAEIAVRFVGELTSVVRDSSGEIIEGKPNEIKRQKDVWVFSRQMGSDDPNWQLVATDE